VTKVGVVVAGSSDLTKTSIARDLSVGFFFLLVFAVFLFHQKISKTKPKISTFSSQKDFRPKQVQFCYLNLSDLIC
jgi:hypothetical protein